MYFNLWLVNSSLSNKVFNGKCVHFVLIHLVYSFDYSSSLILFFFYLRIKKYGGFLWFIHWFRSIYILSYSCHSLHYVPSHTDSCPCSTLALPHMYACEGCPVHTGNTQSRRRGRGSHPQDLGRWRRNCWCRAGSSLFLSPRPSHLQL